MGCCGRTVFLLWIAEASAATAVPFSKLLTLNYQVIRAIFLANAQWSVKMPQHITALTGSCVIIPCQFTCPTNYQPKVVVWYQYVSRGYPLVYSEKNPDDVVDKFKHKTELVGNVAEKSCSLKIKNVHSAQNQEKIYVWIDPDKISYKSYRFYDITVTLNVKDVVSLPEMSVSGKQTAGKTIKVKCTAVHTCPSSPPSLSFGDRQGNIQVSHTKEDMGQWRVTAEISWKAHVEDHGKTVSCTVTHPENRSATKTVPLTVTYAPVSVEVTTEKNVVRQGSDVLLSCKSKANPPASDFKWYRIKDHWAILLGNTAQHISISNLDPDENHFRCMAINSFGSRNSSSDFLVVAEYKPSILAESHCSYHQGLLSCHCLVRARPSASVQWIWGNDVQTTGFSQELVFQNHTESFWWTARDTTSQKSVSCLAQNIYGMDKSKLKIFIKASPYNVSVTQHPARPLEGQPVTLSCLSQSYPPPTSYQWYWMKGGQQEGASQNFYLAKVSRDTEYYRCSARNDFGESSSKFMPVNVEYAPVILNESSCILNNNWLRCECVVDANPMASVRLTSLDHLRSNTRKISSVLSGNTLRHVVSGFLEKQVQQINCSASNDHGTELYQLPFVDHSLPFWLIGLGVGGGLLLCLFGGIACQRVLKKKTRSSVADKSMAELMQIREEQMKIKEEHPCTSYQADMDVYEVEYNDPMVPEPQRQRAYFDDNIYANC